MNKAQWIVGAGLGMVLFAAQSFAENTSYSGPMTQHAKENGVKTCLSAVHKIDKFLYEKAGSSGVSSTWNSGNANTRGFTALGLQKYSDGTWGYDVAHVSPTKGNTCDGALSRIVTFPNKSCSSVRESTYKEFEYKGELAGKAIFGKGSQDLVLEELTGSCIAIRAEALFGM